jgi:hypothetical protein
MLNVSTEHFSVAQQKVLPIMSRQAGTYDGRCPKEDQTMPFSSAKLF